MASVYSTRFIAVAGLAGFSTYTVPAGYRAVIRTATLFVPASVGGGECNLLGSAGEIVAQAYANPAEGAYTRFDGRYVADEGEGFAVFAAAGLACDASVSGYLLSLP